MIDRRLFVRGVPKSDRAGALGDDAAARGIRRELHALNEPCRKERLPTAFQEPFQRGQILLLGKREVFRLVGRSRLNDSVMLKVRPLQSDLRALEADLDCDFLYGVR